MFPANLKSSMHAVMGVLMRLILGSLCLLGTGRKTGGVMESTANQATSSSSSRAAYSTLLTARVWLCTVPATTTCSRKILLGVMCSATGSPLCRDVGRMSGSEPPARTTQTTARRRTWMSSSSTISKTPSSLGTGQESRIMPGFEDEDNFRIVICNSTQLTNNGKDDKQRFSKIWQDHAIFSKSRHDNDKVLFKNNTKTRLLHFNLRYCKSNNSKIDPQMR